MITQSAYKNSKVEILDLSHFYFMYELPPIIIHLFVKSVIKHYPAVHGAMGNSQKALS